MNILLIEDEEEASDRLTMLLHRYDSSLKITDVIPSVEDAVEWFKSQPAPNLIFMDIHLADGLSFEIFDLVNIKTPVIFTTAFDQYTLKAFKQNSIDYLLKPVNYEELVKALEKYKGIYANTEFDFQQLTDLLKKTVITPNYKSRFVVKSGTKIKFIPVEDIAYFFAEEKVVFLIARDGKRYIVDETIEHIESVLNPDIFFRINRSFIIHLSSISEMEPYFNSRFVLKLEPPCKEEVIVSRPKMQAFRNWLNQ